jgi:hypothetical protein
LSSLSVDSEKEPHIDENTRPIKNGPKTKSTALKERINTETTKEHSELPMSISKKGGWACYKMPWFASQQMIASLIPKGLCVHHQGFLTVDNEKCGMSELAVDGDSASGQTKKKTESFAKGFLTRWAGDDGVNRQNS